MKEMNSPSSIIDIADANVIAVQQAQQRAEIENASKRQAERKEKYEAWSDPEAIQYRKILHEKKSFESLQTMKAAGQCEDPTPLPSDDELPKHMRGQQPSTVRAWIRGNPKWEQKVQEHRKQVEAKDAKRQIMRVKYPGLFGIDDEQARKMMADKPTEDFKVMTGKSPIKRIDSDLKYIERILTRAEQKKPLLRKVIDWMTKSSRNT